jgi:hypothetical protein
LTKDSTSTYANVKDIWNADRSFADGTARLKDLVVTLVTAAMGPEQQVFFILDALRVFQVVAK